MVRYNTLEELDVEIIDGDRGKNYPNEKELFDDGYCLFLSAKNVTSNGFEFATKQYISEEKDNLLRNGKLCRNDIVITTRGTVGNVAYYSNKVKYDNLRINSGMLIVRPKNNYNTKYLYYVLKSDFFAKQIHAIQTGSAQLQLPKSHFQKMKIPVFEKKTQDKIAYLLSLIDERIDNNNKINKNLLEQAIAFYINFVKNKQENGILGDIIVENEKSKVKVNEAKDQTGSIPFFTSGQAILKVNDYLVDGQNIYLNTGGNADIKYYIGKASYSTDTWSIKSKEKLTDYLFLLLYTIKTEINDSYFEGSALKHLQKSNLKKREIYIPNNNEKNNLHEILHPLLENISFNERETEQLAKLRDSLLPKLMSGEIDVSKIDI